MKLLSTLFFLSIVVAIHADCNDGDFKHDGYCYTIPVFTHNAGMSHSDGQAYCRQHGANLPALHSREQEDFHVTMLIRVFGKGFSWIGLNHPGKWDDGSNVDYVNWDEEYPKNISHCVMEYYNHKKTNEGFWRDDYNCSTKAKFFCQYPSNPVVTLSTVPSTRSSTLNIPTSTINPPILSPCDNSNVKVDHRCYSLYLTRLNYTDAVEACKVVNKTLGVFDNMNQVKTVNDFVKSITNYEYFLIGLHRNSQDNKFYWPGNVPMTFSYWSPGEPEAITGYNAVTPNTLSWGEWYNYPDSYTWPYVCSGSY